MIVSEDRGAPSYSNFLSVPSPFDISKLQFEVEKLVEVVPFHQATNQISLKHRPGSPFSFYDGAMSLYNPDDGTFLAEETEFSVVNEVLSNWYMKEVVETVEASLPFPVGRVRLMRIPPKSCLSFHWDREFRLHIPIFTNTQCYLVFKNEVQHLPSDRVHIIRATNPHTALNGHSDHDRVHLVFSICTDLDESWNQLSEGFLGLSEVE